MDNKKCSISNLQGFTEMMFGLNQQVAQILENFISMLKKEKRFDFHRYLH